MTEIAKHLETILRVGNVSDDKQHFFFLQPLQNWIFRLQQLDVDFNMNFFCSMLSNQVYLSKAFWKKELKRSLQGCGIDQVLSLLGKVWL